MTEYDIEGYYGAQHGWECLTTEENLPDAREMKRCYDDNEPAIRHRIRRVTAR